VSRFRDEIGEQPDVAANMLAGGRDRPRALSKVTRTW
jgi:hypothetical protein